MRLFSLLAVMGVCLAAGVALAAPLAAPKTAPGDASPALGVMPAHLKADRLRTLANAIDRCIEKKLAEKKRAIHAPATDAEFVRRVYLDVMGRVPSADEAQIFFADRAPDKRTQLVDALLGSPGYVSRQFNFLADMLRVKDQYNRSSGLLYADWLKDRIRDGTPWDALVRQMVCAEGKLCDNGATGFLLRDADMPLDGMSNLMTTFLGANMACAQCHDHPFAEWSQHDFYQMAAFFGATSVRDKKSAGKSARAVFKRKDDELPIPKPLAQRIVFANVMQVADENRNHLRLPSNYKYDDAKPGTLVTPAFMAWTPDDAKTRPYQVDLSDPSKWRSDFAGWLTSPENPRFSANIANRMWKKLFGQAVREPVGDLDDPASASNPELLALLAQTMGEVRFDLREFQRVVLNTRAYQAAAQIPGPDENFDFQGPLVRRMSAEQAWDSIVLLAVGPEVDEIREQRGKLLTLVSIPGNDFSDENLKAALGRLQEAGLDRMATPNKPDKANKRARRAAQMPERTSGKDGGAMAMAPEKSGKNDDGNGGGTRMGAKMVQAILNNYTGPHPKGFGGAGLLVRASELQQPAPETHFLRVFGQSDRLISNASASDGSVPQALALMNGPVSRVVTDSHCAALRAAKEEGAPEAQVAKLWLAFYARKPTGKEARLTQSALEAGATLPDLAWALLNSHEFLFIR